MLQVVWVYACCLQVTSLDMLLCCFTIHAIHQIEHLRNTAKTIVALSAKHLKIEDENNDLYREKPHYYHYRKDFSLLESPSEESKQLSPSTRRELILARNLDPDSGRKLVSSLIKSWVDRHTDVIRYVYCIPNT